MIPENMIDLTGVDKIKLIQKVYELSVPLGMGFLHFRDEPLSEEDAKSCLREYDTTRNPEYGQVIIGMDYVHGRACKFNAWVNSEGELYCHDRWFDHTPEQLETLLESIK
jgi:hypothetical protein